MPSPPLRILVVLFWIGMMGWLARREAVPRLVTGKPPDYRTLAGQAIDADAPVRWSVHLGQELVGWAETSIQPRSDGGRLLISQVELSHLPLLGGLEAALARPTELKVTSRLRISSGGNLESLRILGRLRGIDDTLTLDGVVRNDQLQITVQMGRFREESTLPYKQHGLVLDAFSPLERLPALRVGQTWNVPMINPLSRRTEMLRARVVQREVITWNGSPVTALLVEQRGPADLTARCWVRHDGMVLRQEVPLWWSTLRFEREPAEERVDSLIR